MQSRSHAFALEVEWVKAFRSAFKTDEVETWLHQHAGTINLAFMIRRIELEFKFSMMGSQKSSGRIFMR